MADAAFAVHCSPLSISSLVTVAHEINIEELLTDLIWLASGFREMEVSPGGCPSPSLMFPVALVRVPGLCAHTGMLSEPGIQLIASPISA